MGRQNKSLQPTCYPYDYSTVNEDGNVFDDSRRHAKARTRLNSAFRHTQEPEMEWLLATFAAIVAIIVGAAMLVVGGWSAFHALRLTFSWPKTSAQIVRYWITRSEDKPDGQRFFHPVVKFETAEGRRVVAIASWGSWRRPWPVGRIVSVAYNPRNPNWAEIRCFANVWQIPVTLVGLAAVLGLILWFFRLH